MSPGVVADSAWGGRDLEDDPHVRVIDLHATHEGQDDRPLQRVVGGVQPGANLRRERLQPANRLSQFHRGDPRGLPLGHLLLEQRHALPQPRQPRRELLLRQQSLGVVVDRPRPREVGRCPVICGCAAAIGSAGRRWYAAAKCSG